MKINQIVTDDYQIHFIYLLTADGKDREWDINEKIENITKKMNNLFEPNFLKSIRSSGNKSYKYDFRKDGKLDITFIRMDMKHKNLHKHLNNNYRGMDRILNSIIQKNQCLMLSTC